MVDPATGKHQALKFSNHCSSSNIPIITQSYRSVDLSLLHTFLWLLNPRGKHNPKQYRSNMHLLNLTSPCIFLLMTKAIRYLLYGNKYLRMPMGACVVHVNVRQNILFSPVYSSHICKFIYICISAHVYKA